MKSFVLGCLPVAFVLPQLATGAREQTRNMPDIISGPNPRGIPGSQDDPTGLLLTTISIN